MAPFLFLHHYMDATPFFEETRAFLWFSRPKAGKTGTCLSDFLKKHVLLGHGSLDHVVLYDGRRKVQPCCCGQKGIMLITRP